YHTVTSQQLLINVFEGPTNNEDVADAGVVKQSIGPSDNQFRFIKLSTDLIPKSSSVFFGSTLYYLLLLIPLLGIPIAILIGKKRAEMASDVIGNRVRKANKLAKKYLSEAKRNIGDKEAFYESLERALHN